MKLVAVFYILAFTLRSLAVPADDLAALIKKGDALDQQLKISEALAIFLDADKTSPNNVEILNRIAREYGLSMGDGPTDAARREHGMKALEYAKRAEALDANNATTELAMAICYGRVAPYLDNKTKIAYSKLVKEHIERSLKLDASNDLAYFVKGSWNFELANLNPVLRMVASAIYGTIPSASNEDAVECYKKALSLNPTRLGTYVELGRAYAAMKQNSLATTNLKKGLEMPSREKRRRGGKAPGASGASEALSPWRSASSFV